MSKITLSNLATLTNEATALSTINANFSVIQNAIDNLLSRDGTLPNTMGANLDMNSYRVQNLPYPASNTEPVRLVDLNSLLSGNAFPSKWYAGSGVPSGSSYTVTDWYLNVTNGDVYEKTGTTTWTLRGNIKGATGATGPTGASGTGSGDMLKSTYDFNADGTVNAADAAPWSGITGKPTTRAGYGITDAQPLSTKLTNLDGLTWGANTFPYFSGTNTVVAGQITAAGLAILDDADAATQRTTLGLGTMATKSTVTTGDITNNAVTLQKLDSTGASGLVLTAQGPGNSPIWASAGSGSTAGHVLLATLTPTATASVSATGLTLSSYRKLLIVYSGVKIATTTSTLQMSDGASTPTVTTLTATVGATTSSFFGYFDLFLDPGLGYGYSSILSSTGSRSTLTGAGAYTGITTSSTSVTFKPSSGNFQAGGTIKIYGHA